jgi:hypothetical protein
LSTGAQRQLVTPCHEEASRTAIGKRSERKISEFLFNDFDLFDVIGDLYDFRIFVESDRGTLVAAQKGRNGENVLSEHSAKLFLPSVDIYMRTRPETQVDLVLAGRGREPG